MLKPLVKLDQPHGCEWLTIPELGLVGLTEWYHLIGRMRGEIWSWMQKHDKHIPVRQGTRGTAIRGGRVLGILDLVEWMEGGSTNPSAHRGG